MSPRAHTLVGSLQRLSTDRPAEVDLTVHVAGCDALQKILQPIDPAEIRPYDKRAFAHFDIHTIFSLKSCPFSHVLRYSDGHAIPHFSSVTFIVGVIIFYIVDTVSILYAGTEVHEREIVRSCRGFDQLRKRTTCTVPFNHSFQRNVHHLPLNVVL